MVVYFGSSPVMWAFRKQHAISRSSTKGEYCALVDNTSKIMLLYYDNSMKIKLLIYFKFDIFLVLLNKRFCLKI